MITRDNVKAVFEEFNNDEIEACLGSDHDDIGCYITGNCGVVIIEPLEAGSLNAEQTEEYLASGGFICDKDTFLTMFRECGAINPAFDGWV